MINDTIFEVPVYTCNQKQANARISKQVDKNMRNVPDYGTGFWEEQRDSEFRRRCGPIRFNEIIGFIDVHIVGSQLRADYWFVDRKRITGSPCRRPVKEWKNSWYFDYLNGDASTSASGRKRTFISVVFTRF